MSPTSYSLIDDERNGASLKTMSSWRARVKDGRIVVNEPTELPEGTELELMSADDVDELDPESRAKLYGFLASSIESHVPGSGTSAAALLAELRSR